MKFNLGTGQNLSKDGTGAKCMGTRTFFTLSSNGAAAFFSVNEHGASTFFRAAAEMFFRDNLSRHYFFLLSK